MSRYNQKSQNFAGGKSALIVGLVCVSLLSGCANVYETSEELRADPHQKGSLNFAQPYSTVLANITYGADKCFPARSLNSFPGYIPSVTASKMSSTSTELESGKLARVEALTTGRGVFLSIDIRAVPSGTAVDYYISRRLFGTYDDSSSFAPIANAWVSGDASKCG